MASYAAVLSAWGDYLQTFDFNIFATFTFAPNPEHIWAAPGAFRALRRVMRSLDCRTWFAVAENHKWKNDVHLHALLQSEHQYPVIGKAWEHGYNRLLPVNDRAAGYCAKYLSKTRDVPIDFELANYKEPTLFDERGF